MLPRSQRFERSYGSGPLDSPIGAFFSGFNPDDSLTGAVNDGFETSARNEVPMTTIDAIKDGMVYDSVANRVIVPEDGL